MKSLCLKIPNVDRIGLIKDISCILAERQINILSMEVKPNTVFLEINLLTEDDKCYIFNTIKAIPQVIDVQEIDLMPYQEKAEQLKAVLGSVSDGIIAMDPQGNITQHNPAAEKITHLTTDQLARSSLDSLFPAGIVPLRTLLQTGTGYDNCEVINISTQSHYLTSGRPIMDSNRRIIGAVAILKDISDVRDLVYTVTGQSSFSFGDILYTSKAMQRAATLAKTIAQGDSTVLIRGETGTGKELFAKAIHDTSARAKELFVPLNCAAIPDTLLETELFGYKDGAFTGSAKGGKKGLFEFADGGTIFLDEIGELSTSLQAKLLRVLQEGKIRRIGDTQEIPVNVRVLAATNRNLEEMIQQGKFREDLYYRINVIPLFIPPLKTRREDIPLLAQLFLRRYAARLHKPVTAISESVLQKLMEYHWPGNIRELENVIERAVNLVTGSILLNEHIIFDHDYSPAPLETALPECSLDEILDKVERDVLMKALTQHRTLRQLGKALSLSHTAVLKKLRKHGLRIVKK